MSHMLTGGLAMSGPSSIQPIDDIRETDENFPEWFKRYEPKMREEIRKGVEQQHEKKMSEMQKKIERLEKKGNENENEKSEMQEKIERLEKKGNENENEKSEMRKKIERLEKKDNDQTIMKLQNDWRANEDKNWTLHQIDEFYEIKKREFEGQESVLTELDKLYRRSITIRRLRSFGIPALIGLGTASISAISICLTSAEVAAAVGFTATATACAFPVGICVAVGAGVALLLGGGIWLYIKAKQHKVFEKMWEKIKNGSRFIFRCGDSKIAIETVDGQQQLAIQPANDDTDDEQ